MRSPELIAEDGDAGVSSVRVLVVEDSVPFRRFVCSTLEKRPELQVICEVSDGLEAVQKAEELNPDLILLDIGLPRLNGIEAALRIRKLSWRKIAMTLTVWPPPSHLHFTMSRDNGARLPSWRKYLHRNIALMKTSLLAGAVRGHHATGPLQRSSNCHVTQAG